MSTQLTHTPYVPPALRIPPEIVRDIFIAARSDHLRTEAWWAAGEINRFEFEADPFVFIHVCQSWRFIAMEYAQMWTRVYVDLDKVSRQNPMVFIAHHAICSRGRPVHFYLRSLKRQDAPMGRAVVNFFRSCAQLASTLELRLSPAWTQYFFEIQNIRFPKLKSLLVETRYTAQIPELDCPVSVLDAPLLQEVGYVSHTALPPSVHAALPFWQFTKLFMEEVDISPMEYEDIMSICDLLAYGSFSIDTYELGFEADPILQALSRPSMLHLALTIHGKVPIHGVYDHFRFPNLLQLRLDSEYHAHKWYHEAMLELSRATCLQRLEIHGLRVRHEEMVEFLKLTPSLRYLTIDNIRTVSGSRKLMSTLTWPDSSLCARDLVLPNLQELQITHWHDSFPSRRFLRMIKSRASTLKLVRFFRQDEILHAEMLRDIKLAGVQADDIDDYYLFNEDMTMGFLVGKQGSKVSLKARRWQAETW